MRWADTNHRKNKKSDRNQVNTRKYWSTTWSFGCNVSWQTELSWVQSQGWFDCRTLSWDNTTLPKTPNQEVHSVLHQVYYYYCRRTDVRWWWDTVKAVSFQDEPICIHSYKFLWDVPVDFTPQWFHEVHHFISFLFLKKTLKNEQGPSNQCHPSSSTAFDKTVGSHINTSSQIGERRERRSATPHDTAAR